jgi:hypothetical protein
MSRKKTLSEREIILFKPPEIVINFFNAISEGKVKEAEDVLNHVIEFFDDKEYDKFQGYIRGLEGLFLSIKEKNRSTYLSEITNSPEIIKKMEKEFRKNVKNEIYSPYDKVYFKALLDYTRFLLNQ